MEKYRKLIIDVFNKDVDNEIKELDEIMDILGDSNSIVDTDNVSMDLKIMTARKTAFKDAKSMILKASLKVEGIDNEKIMTQGEKKLFYRIVRFIYFFRRLFSRF